MSITTKLFGRELPSPVIPASGTFGFGYEFGEYYDLNVLGAIALKGTTLEARYGNPLPRIAECPSGLLNAIGLQNPGVDEVIATEIPKLRAVYGGAVIANVGGHSVGEYVETCRRFDGSSEVFAIELNISCPNVKGGGMAFGTNAQTAQSLVYEVKKHTLKPIIVKLSPNVTDVTEIAKAVLDGGADGLCLINTLVGARFDLRSGKPILSTVSGGYSGPGVFPIALKMVYEVAKRFDVPIIGVGGISSAQDVIEMMSAGASAVEIGSLNLVNPTACYDVIAALPTAMSELGISDLSAIIGRSLR